MPNDRFSHQHLVKVSLVLRKPWRADPALNSRRDMSGCEALLSRGQQTSDRRETGGFSFSCRHCRAPPRGPWAAFAVVSPLFTEQGIPTMVHTPTQVVTYFSQYCRCCCLILSSRLKHVMALLRPWCRHGQVEIHNDLRHRSFGGRMAARSETRETMKGESREAKKRSQKMAQYIP